MKKLKIPDYDFSEVIDKCFKNILRGNEDLKKVIARDKVDILLDGECYVNDSINCQLFTYEAFKRCHNSENIDPKTQNYYIKLYNTYFVPENKPETRKIYDAILNSAKEDCPFCGGIGKPENLDHFLPKTRFPQFSVFPSNLIPACMACNLNSKHTSYAKIPEVQTIHPYFDKSIFFDEQWITADYIIDDPINDFIIPGRFEYYANPPEEWNNIDKLRVYNYFDDFDLGKRYAKQTIPVLKSKLREIKRALSQGIDVEEVISDIIQQDIDDASFKNHWIVGMCDALIKHLRSNQAI